MVLAYGDSPFLAGCLASLKAQMQPSRIVVSTSTPSAIIEQAAGTAGAALLVNSGKRGIGPDWNFALHNSGARYVTLAHQDDLYAATFTAATLDLFTRYPEGALSFTGYQEIDDAGRPKSSRVSRIKHLIEALTIGWREAVTGLRLRMFLSFGNPLPCSSVTFDLQRLADFSFDETYVSNLDWDAWWRLYAQGEVFLHAPARLVGRRHNALTETSRLIQSGQRQREDAEMFRRIWPAPLDRMFARLYSASYGLHKQ